MGRFSRLLALSLLSSCAASPIADSAAYNAALKNCIAQSHSYDEYKACADGVDAHWGQR